MKRKRSIRNESGDDPRIHSSTLLTTEEDSILISTQETAMNGHLNGTPAGYNFRHYSLDNLGSPIPECTPSDQQHGTTVFNIDRALTQC
ncbi:hypothetical protein G6F57_001460 [Rhizopus arrhizus]|uniref:Uncharacterized protein n=1 Tax=Rhizopus oryzae TaxID=64495 RepID=A0A9P7BS98_RHIOR|nr:hypothetical protein G6F23_008644 [Rhizopus arrhizus]KAG0769356.1 hypothetical protein G6F24_001144 [Rhizopus arrhizus]KAG0797327.1 hypothetical protein G6F21_000614 [Rhizopus arrhizus]KAG0799974.1 hypothetical protein G6F22_002693 [Rhizopus arrhizus]KAG0811061.1 hypothetical protein G6F20_007452 [Rhizopus arrhizus]